MSNENQNINNEILNSVRNEFLGKVHNRANMLSDRSEDVYASIKSMGYDTYNPESIKKWYKTFNKRNRKSSIINQILEQMAEEYVIKQKEAINNYINTQIENLKLKQTSNPKYLISDSGKYYRLEDCDFVEEPNIINIDENGNYIIKQLMENGCDYLVTTYNVNGRAISLKILNTNNEIYKSEKYVAKKLKLKQELVKKYKLHGYSGNSSGLFASVANMVTSPLPSGYYFDKSYNFFKWNNKHGEFVLNTREGKQIGAPLMSDYDIYDNFVIRTDYDGAGIIL